MTRVQPPLHIYGGPERHRAQIRVAESGGRVAESGGRVAEPGGRVAESGARFAESGVRSPEFQNKE